MPKKETTKNPSDKSPSPKKIPSYKKASSRDSDSTEKILVDNFVALQRVLTNLSIKFDNLSTQISKLLEIFEISAKTLAERAPTMKEGGNSREISEKIDNLLEQNKVIARGLTLLHETNPIPQRMAPQQQGRNPSSQMPMGKNSQAGRIDEYQKSTPPRQENEAG